MKPQYKDHLTEWRPDYHANFNLIEGGRLCACNDDELNISEFQQNNS